jgi:hypothetical protein
MARSKEVEFEVKQSREISDVEIEMLARILFRWWERETENNGREASKHKNQKK